MDNNFFNEKNVTYCLYVILFITAVVWIISLLSKYEKFQSIASNEAKPQAAQSDAPVLPTQPQQLYGNLPVLPTQLVYQPTQTMQTQGLLIDGPGFEKDDKSVSSSQAGTVPSSRIPSNFYFLDDGLGGAMSLHNNLCSKSCCTPQWHAPFMQEHNKYVCANKDKFVQSSQYFCQNDTNDTGCLCLTKEQRDFYMSRGGNSPYI